MAHKFFIAFLLFCVPMLFSQSLVELPGSRITPLVKKIHKNLPSVVSISTVDERGQRKILGSGVIIDKSGIILSCLHVVESSQELNVQLFNGQELKLRRLYSQKNSDLVLLKIDEKIQVKAIAFAYPNDLLLGEQVIAIGNPFGLSHSIAVGVLSSAQRQQTLFQRSLKLIQADLNLNPGNSGGPLINANGELIGINIARQAKGKGISYAIPIGEIERFLSSYFKTYQHQGQMINFLISTSFDPHTRNAHISIDRLRLQRHLSRAAIQGPFAIANIDGFDFSQAIDVFRYLWRRQDNDIVIIALENHAILRLLARSPQSLLRKEVSGLALGLEFEEINQEIADSLDLPFRQGLLLSNINSKVQHYAPYSELQRSDLLVKANNSLIPDKKSYETFLKERKVGEEVELTFLRIIKKKEKQKVISFRKKVIL